MKSNIVKTSMSSKKSSGQLDTTLMSISMLAPN
jgi:hypothetical protein